ncbi:MAG: glycosyltransferase family 39 protein [Elusimicrobia bacterium]|nr:glycosyltransferase family 39 protein [Elusimicrobiota bacterium]
MQIKKTTLLQLIVLFIVSLYIANYVHMRSGLVDFVTENELSLPTIYSVPFGNTFSEVAKSVNHTKGFGVSWDYPPLYTASVGFALLATGKLWGFAILLVNTFYLLVLLVFLYFLGKEMGGALIGVISCIVVLLYPSTYAGYNMFSLDFPLMACMVFSIYALIKSRNFIDIRWCVLLGISIGVSMMVRETYGAFIVGPIILGFYVASKKIAQNDLSSMKNFFFCMCLAAIIMLPYYADGRVLTSLYSGPFAGLPSLYPWYSFESLRIIGLWDNQLTPFFLIILLFGVYFFMREVDKDVKVIIALWIVIPMVITLFMKHQNSPRYLLPLQPAFALISAFALKNIVVKKRGLIAIVLIVLIGLFQLSDITYGTLLKSVGYENLRYFQENPDFEISIEKKLIKSQAVKTISKRVLMQMQTKKRSILTDDPFVVLSITSGGERSWADYCWVDYVLPRYFQLNEISVQYLYSFQAGIRMKAGHLSEVTNMLNEIDAILYFVPVQEQNFQKSISIDVIRDNTMNYWRGDSQYSDVMLYEGLWHKFNQSLRAQGIIFQDSKYKVYYYYKTYGDNEPVMGDYSPSKRETL